MSALKSAFKEGNLWFPNVRSDSRVQLRLFCFPYAGGGTNIYRSWAAKLPPQVDVCAAQLPGRGQRIREASYTNVPELTKGLAEGIRPFLNQPFAFFGHSMGAMLAFELTRELRRTQNPQPVHLFASGRIAPQVRCPKDRTYDLPQPQFIEKVLEMNGTPKEIMEHPELMGMMIPLLRADFEVVETYTYEPDAPLDCPITVLGGLQDFEVPRESLEAWHEQTTSPTFSVRILQGDHFFVNTAQMFIFRILTDEIYKHLK